MACSVTVEIERYQMCSMRKYGYAESQTTGIAYRTRRALELISTGMVFPSP